jgi:hypothetical protein
MGCFHSSEGFSQAVPESGGLPALFCSYSAASLTAQVFWKCRSSKCYLGSAKVESDQGRGTGGSFATVGSVHIGGLWQIG